MSSIQIANYTDGSNPIDIELESICYLLVSFNIAINTIISYSGFQQNIVPKMFFIEPIL